MKSENKNRDKLPFEIIWGLVVSTISVALSITCYIKFTNEWFLFLGSLSGSVFFAIGRIALAQKEEETG